MVRETMEIPDKIQHLQGLLEKAIDRRNDNWARFARELQDEVVQLISATRYEIMAAQYSWERGRAGAAETSLESASEMLDELERQIRGATGPSLTD
jgi:signal transduction histidine kinase